MVEGAFGIIGSFARFVKQLYFDKKEEADFSSDEFKPKRWIGYVLALLFFCLSIFTVPRLIMLAQEYKNLRDKYEQLKTTVEEQQCGPLTVEKKEKR